MRDLLPPEAYRHAELGRRVVECFQLHGYESVTVPLFEFTEVVDRGLGGQPNYEVLRFVEPESGAIVALRPDMTPQIARLLATRLAGEPGPARLCYQGSVLRRQRQRARRQQQVPQAGIELIGREGPGGDLEVLSVATAAVRASGLSEFVLDLGHARIAAALVEPLDAIRARAVLEALEVKDESELVRRAEQHGLPARELSALAALPSLHGAEEIWPRAERVLSGTAAAPALNELRKLWDAACAAELAPSVLVDLSETRDFAYYTGSLFQIYAHGPGRAIGAGGRYDGLLERFGAPRPAVGFAFELDDLGWALTRAGKVSPLPARLLLIAQAAELAPTLRSAGFAAAVAPDENALAHARAWRYSHLVEVDVDSLRVTEVASGSSETLRRDPSTLVAMLLARSTPGPGSSGKDIVCRQ
ncbi:MAG TPA: ATP phosphoribosyltransferase regulatory subunit [Polyangiaceae bacterium]|nr:ATP phosphoribosyltransferase regulatory subunit [Polyangiaceae bacterium]